MYSFGRRHSIFVSIIIILFPIERWRLRRVRRVNRFFSRSLSAAFHLFEIMAVFFLFSSLFLWIIFFFFRSFSTCSYKGSSTMATIHIGMCVVATRNTTCSTHTVNCYWRLQSFNHSQLLLSRWYSVLIESWVSAKCNLAMKTLWYCILCVCMFSSVHVEIEIGKWEEKRGKKKQKWRRREYYVRI